MIPVPVIIAIVEQLGSLVGKVLTKNSDTHPAIITGLNVVASALQDVNQAIEIVRAAEAEGRAPTSEEQAKLDNMVAAAKQRLIDA